MGKRRGERNGKLNVQRLQNLKRENAQFFVNGRLNEQLLHEETEKLLADMPNIEVGNTIFSQVAVNLSATTKFKLPKDNLPIIEKVAIRINVNLAEIDCKIQRKEKQITRLTTDAKPLSDTPLDLTPIKHVSVGLVCDRCGGPRGGAAKSLVNPRDYYCKVCYRLNAQERRALDLAKNRGIPLQEAQQKVTHFEDVQKELLQQKEDVLKKKYESKEKRDLAVSSLYESIDMYNYWVDDFRQCIAKANVGGGFDGDNFDNPVAAQKYKEGTIKTLNRVIPDFSENLLDMIEQTELETGVPMAKWIQTGLLVDEKKPSPKPLYHAVEMAVIANTPPQKTHIRRFRPRAKTIRGIWG